MSILATLLVFLTVSSFCYLVVPAWDEVGQLFVKDLKPRIEALDIDQQVVLNIIRWWGIALSAIAFVVGVFWGKPILAVGIFVVVATLPRIILDNMIKNRRIKLRDQLVSASTGLANTSRAGLTLVQGLQSITPDVPQPLGKEFSRVLQNYEAGLPLKQAIREVKERLDIESFNIFSSAIMVALDQGGRITTHMDKISLGLREFQRLERKIETASAGGRRMAMVLGLFPIIFLFGFYVLDPQSVGLMFSTILGQLALVVIGILIFLAMRWCNFILDIEI